jgi:hypothetical protein
VVAVSYLDPHALTLPVSPPAFPSQNNPQMFMTPLQFEIQYECLQPLANGARTPEPSPDHRPTL